jgi:hypothetical protein
MSPLGSWFKKPSSTPGPQRAERREAPGLAAYHLDGSVPKLDPIKNISSSGAYLVTRDRWFPGTEIALTLQREGPLETGSDRCFELKARTVRWGEDGIGLSFILPSGMDVRLWGNPLSTSTEPTEPEEILREFRLAEALAFLTRVCPSAEQEVSLLMRKGLSNFRVLSAVEIALKAEKLLASQPDIAGWSIPRQIILRILEDGSWTEEDWIRNFWAGLVITSCSIDGKSGSNLIFVDLLSQLAAMHTRILQAACTRAETYVSAPGQVSAHPIECSAEELIQITGSHDLVRIERDLGHLSDLGLLENREKSPFFSRIDNTFITPTSLGLRLYARCHGHHGATQDFYHSTVPESNSVTT